MLKYFEAIEELPEEFKRPLVKILELFREDIADSIKRSDFERFEKETRENFNRVWKSIEELAEAQKRTEFEITKLTKGLHETRGEIGGLSKSMSYEFENEAFRKLPDFLKEKYGIELKERLIREEIGGKEINIFGRAGKNGTEVLVVGESKLRLDERKDKKVKDVFDELEEKVKAVKGEYGEAEAIKILITHYATKGFLKKAKEKGVIVVQSFGW